MKDKHTFKAVIQDAGSGGAYVDIPFDVEAAFGKKKPRVKAVIEGVLYRGILTRTPALASGASVGGEHHILIILKAIREQIGKTFNDEVKISIEPDTEPRVVEVPKDLLKELKKDKEVKAFFDKLSYTHRREYVMWINEAKREETRQSRIMKTIEMLKQGKKAR